MIELEKALDKVQEAFKDFRHATIMYHLLKDRPVSSCKTWVSVKERLPKLHATIIVWGEGNRVREAVYMGDKKFTDIHLNFDWTWVTHWMPLPEPPKATIDKAWFDEATQYTDGELEELIDKLKRRRK